MISIKKSRTAELPSGIKSVQTTEIQDGSLQGENQQANKNKKGITCYISPYLQEFYITFKSFEKKKKNLDIIKLRSAL